MTGEKKKRERDQKEETKTRDVVKTKKLKKTNFNEDLPRGGHVAIPTTKAISHNDDNLFSALTKQSKPKQKKKDSKIEEEREEQPEEESDLESEEASMEIESPRATDKKEKKTKKKEQTPKIVNDAEERAQPLTIATMEPGMTLLAFVKSIGKEQILLDLPRGFIASLSPIELSDVFAKISAEAILKKDTSSLPDWTTFLKIGQIVRVCITSAESKKIEVTMRSSHINNGHDIDTIYEGLIIHGAIKSIEDHGYSIETGIPHCTTFLNKKETNGENFQLGQPLDLVVHSINKQSKIVLTTIQKKQFSRLPNKKQSENITANTLKAGMLIPVVVAKVLSRSLVVQALGFLYGLIEQPYLDKFINSKNSLQTYYKEGQKLNARMLYVGSSVKVFGFSIKPHLIDYKSPSFQDIQLGQIFQESTLKSIVPPTGIILKLTDNIDGYARIEDMEQSGKPLESRFQDNQEIPSRIIGFNYLTGFATVTTKKSDLENPFFSINDIQIGAITQGKIAQVTEDYVLVQLSSRIKGICYSQHLGETTIDPRSKYKEGQLLKVRVISIDTEKKQIVLTHRPSLIETRHPVIKSYESIKPGMTSVGVVQRIEDYGIIVRFYNNITGLIPKKELQQAFPLQDYKHLFQEYQSITCVISSCNPEAKKLYLALKQKKSIVSTAELEIGSIVSAKISEVTPEHLVVIVTTTDGKQAMGTIADYHLTDHSSNVALVKQSYKIGDEIPEALVIIKKTQGWRLSTKQSLLAAVKNKQLPTSYSSISTGMILSGVITKTLNDVVIVSFLAGTRGIVPIANPNEFTKGQSVTVKVVSVDATNEKLLLKFLSNDTNAISSGEWIASYFQERSLVNTDFDWSEIRVGDEVEGKVTSVSSDVTRVALTKYPKLKAVVSSLQLLEPQIPGAILKAKVIDITYTEGQVELSPLLAAVDTNPPQKRLEQLMNNKFHATILSVKGDYLVLHVKDQQHHMIGFSGIKDLFPLGLPNIELIGKQVQATLYQLSSQNSFKRNLLRVQFSKAILHEVIGKTTPRKPTNKQIDLPDDVIIHKGKIHPKLSVTTRSKKQIE